MKQHETIALYDSEDTIHFVIPSSPDTVWQIDLTEAARGATGCCGGDGCSCTGGDGCCAPGG